jgi:hypothetical protein
MPNASEWNTIIPVIVALAGPYLAKFGITDDTLRNWLETLGAFAIASYMIWSAWNMKRVKETAIVSGHAATAAEAAVLSAPAHENPTAFNANPANRMGG